jgi:DNA-directed RNA polymerase subunit alpha
MFDTTIQIPSQPKVVKEDGFTGLYQIDGLYPGYGHTLGNSLRRIILSSLPGAAITSVKIDGVDHEFSTIEGIKEDVVVLLLNLKQVRLRLDGDGPQVITLSKKGEGVVTAADIQIPGQIEILNPELEIAHITNKKTELEIEMTVEKGLGYVAREIVKKEKVAIGTIALDSNFTPVRRVNYEVENMRVGDRTDFNRLNIFIESDGTVTPKEILEKSIYIMIEQLKAIVGFVEEVKEVEEIEEEVGPTAKEEAAAREEAIEEELEEFLKTRIESLNLSTRTENALTSASIRTVGGLVRKKEADVEQIEGLGGKGIQEIKRALGNYGITLK